MPQVALHLHDIVHAHPGKPILLDHVGLDVASGRITVVMGANGSGKTTFLRIAAGLARPLQGRAILGDGTPVPLAMRKGRIGYIPQQLGLVRSASVLANALLGGLRASGPGTLLGHHPASVRARALAALDEVGLADRADQPAATLSGGERQRVAIARTLVQQPEIIVADELIASLDAGHAREVMEICARLRGRGVTMLMALHQVDVALAHADALHFLARGNLSAGRRPGELTADEARAALQGDALVAEPSREPGLGPPGTIGDPGLRPPATTGNPAPWPPGAIGDPGLRSPGTTGDPAPWPPLPTGGPGP